MYLENSVQTGAVLRHQLQLRTPIIFGKFGISFPQNVHSLKLTQRETISNETFQLLVIIGNLQTANRN